MINVWFLQGYYVYVVSCKPSACQHVILTDFGFVNVLLPDLQGFASSCCVVVCCITHSSMNAVSNCSSVSSSDSSLACSISICLLCIGCALGLRLYNLSFSCLLFASSAWVFSLATYSSRVACPSSFCPVGFLALALVMFLVICALLPLVAGGGRLAIAIFVETFCLYLTLIWLIETVQLSSVGKYFSTFLGRF